MPDPSGNVIVWHDTIHGQSADGVPDLIQSTNDLVTRFLEANQAWATTAIADARAAVAALANSAMPLQFPDPPDPPDVEVHGNLGGTLGAAVVPGMGSIDEFSVAGFVPDDVVIPDLAAEMPEYVPVIGGLSIPEPPIFVAPQAPMAPGIDLTFNIGTVPVKDYGLPPDLAAFNLPTYVPPVLPVFNDEAPEFDTLPPSPFVQWVEPVYQSDVKDAIEAVLTEMLAGGTGLPVDVEQALWERGRQREDAGTMKLVNEAIDQWASRGFSHPPGQLNSEIIAVREEGLRKANEQSREVMIEQAKLEQTNRNFAVEKGITFEQVYVGLFLAIVERNFQIAKFSVETQIQIYNMAVTAFNVRQLVFTQKGERFKLLLESAMAGLKVFLALIEAEKAKGALNEAMVNAFKAKVEAYGKQVEAFKALTEAEVARAGMQKLKVDIYKGEIEAMVGEVNLQRGAFEAYGERVRGETAKAGLEESNARVFGSRVQAWGILSEQGFKQAEVDMAKNKMRLEWKVADLTRISTLNGQQLNVIQARLAGFQASQSRATAEATFGSSVKQAALQGTIEVSRLGVAKYSAMLEQWKTRGTQILAMAQMNSESLRAVGQITGTMAAGAMAGTHVSAGISGGANSSQTRSDTKNESKTFTQHISDTYGVQHSYPHKVT